ncbi:MAG: RES family NAD+ phosphorylase [Alphaproteobacteria bacterium]
MLARSQVQHRTHRLIASRYPPVGVFDDIAADEEELRVAFLLEAATNDRLAFMERRLGLLPAGEVVNGEGASLVMAAFLHANETGGRFTDARLGAWYAALDIETAIAETHFHADCRLRLSEGAFPSSIQIRELIADIDGTLVDIRGGQGGRPELYAPNPADYGPAQLFAAGLRWPEGGGDPENGIVYDSVRRGGGVNVCLFRPTLVPLPVLQGDHYEYRWDAGGVASVLKITNVAVGS